jgi:hypothetical protein
VLDHHEAETRIGVSRFLPVDRLGTDRCVSPSAHPSWSEGSTTIAVRSARYTQADPAWDRLLAREGAVSHYMYARDNPILWTDPEGLAVRVCCRPVNAPGLRQYDHCYIESNTNGGRTWGLHNQHGQGVYRMNDPSDEGGICSNWKPDPCPNNDCFTRESAKYPLEPYSFVGANTNGAGFSGRNSNTFVKCIMQRCDVPFVDTRVTRNAPGWYQPCP